MSWIRLITAAAVFAVAHAAQAATVSIVPQEGTKQGNLFLNSGRGYAPIVTVTTAHTGDTLMASGTGRAFVIYEDGCRVAVQRRNGGCFGARNVPMQRCIDPGNEPRNGRRKIRYWGGACGGSSCRSGSIGGGGGEDGELKILGNPTACTTPLTHPPFGPFLWSPRSNQTRIREKKKKSASYNCMLIRRMSTRARLGFAGVHY